MTWTSSPLPANCCTSLYKRTCTCEDWPYTIGIGQSLSGLAKARGTSILFKYKQWENSIRGKFQLPIRPLQTRLASITTIVRTRRFRHQAAKRYACATRSWITSLGEDTAASINGCSELSKRSPPLKDPTPAVLSSLYPTRSCCSKELAWRLVQLSNTQGLETRPCPCKLGGSWA